MTEEQINELEWLAKAATPGPRVANNWGRVWHAPSPDSKRLVCDTMRNTVRNPKRWRVNAKLIAAMREAVPELIEMYRKAKDKANDADAAYQRIERDNVDLARLILEARTKIESLELQVSYLAVHATCGCREHGQHGFARCSNCQFHDGMACVEVTADDWEKVARESAKMILE